MNKEITDSAAGMSYYKIQRGAAIAAGTNGYLGHLSQSEIDRRMANYQTLMDNETKGVKS